MSYEIAQEHFGLKIDFPRVFGSEISSNWRSDLGPFFPETTVSQLLKFRALTVRDRRYFESLMKHAQQHSHAWPFARDPCSGSIFSWDEIQSLSRSKTFIRNLGSSNHIFHETVWCKMIEGDNSFVIQQVSAMGMKPPVQVFVPIIVLDQWSICVLCVESSNLESRIVFLLPASNVSETITSTVQSLAKLVLTTLAFSESMVDLKVQFCEPCVAHGDKDLEVIMPDVFLHYNGNVEKINQLVISEAEVMVIRMFNLLRATQGLEILGFRHES